MSSSRKWVMGTLLAIVLTLAAGFLSSVGDPDPETDSISKQTSVPDPEGPPEETDANNAFFNDEVEQRRATGGPYISREEAIEAAGGNRPKTEVLFAEFMTFGEVREKAGREDPDTQIADDREFYLVVLEGSWVGLAPPGIEAPSYENIWAAVDATTGEVATGGSGKAHLDD